MRGPRRPSGLRAIGAVALLGFLASGCESRAEPNVSRAVHEAVAKHGETPPESEYAAIRATARAAFDKAMRDARRDPAPYEIIVHRDAVAGPMVFVKRTVDDKSWPLAVFQAEIIGGR